MSSRELVFLSPVVPASTGNGLAMRAGLQLEALSTSFTVRVAVIPVAGGSDDMRWARRYAERVEVVPLDDARQLRAGVVALLRSDEWRRRFAACDPLPHAAGHASAALAGVVVDAAGASPGTPVHAFRAYLAPLAVAVGERLAAPWLTLDLDDDDEALLSEQGRTDEALAYRRLIETFGPSFAWLSLASPDEAGAVAARHSLPTVVVPNGVEVGAEVAGGSRSPGDPLTLLFVGNLTYEPNVEAAQTLATEVLPRVRALVGRDVRVELVGAFEPDGPVAALGGLDGVELRGYVDELAEAYARADLVVAPLEHGAGSRIKVLEALAAGVPVVTSTAGAAGLRVEHGRDLLLADDAEAMAGAVAGLASDPRRADELAARGRQLVAARYSRAVVSRLLVDLLPAPPGV